MKIIEESIILEQTFDRSIEDVWHAITVLDKMTKWYFPDISSFEPVVGFTTRFVVQIEDRIYPHIWKVKEVIPMRKISYEWKYDGYPGKAISLFELTKTNNKTKLKLTYKIIESFPKNIDEFKRESGVAGWNYFIKESLKKYLEKKN